MKEASTQAEPICSENYSARLNLLRGFLALCYPDEQRLNAVEKLIEAASIQSIKQWRRLPPVVSHAHTPLLQVSGLWCELATDKLLILQWNPSIVDTLGTWYSVMYRVVSSF